MSGAGGLRDSHGLFFISCYSVVLMLPEPAHLQTHPYTWKHRCTHSTQCTTHMHMHAWHYSAPTQTHGCMASHSAHTNVITWRTHTPAFMTSHNMCTPASKTPHTAHIYMCDATLHKYMCMALHTMHMCAYHTAYIYA